MMSVMQLRSATQEVQGKSGTCVRHGIAAAVEDQLMFKLELTVKQASVVDALMQHVDHAHGTWPSVFNDWQGKIRDNDGVWYLLKLSIQQSTSEMQQKAKEGKLKFPLANKSAGTVSISLTTTRRKNWIGHNSWGGADQTPNIPLHAPETTIYTVAVVQLKRLALLKGDPDEILLP